MIKDCGNCFYRLQGFCDTVDDCVYSNPELKGYTDEQVEKLLEVANEEYKQAIRDEEEAEEEEAFKEFMKEMEALIRC